MFHTRHRAKGHFSGFALKRPFSLCRVGKSGFRKRVSRTESPRFFMKMKRKRTERNGRQRNPKKNSQKGKNGNRKKEENGKKKQKKMEESGKIGSDTVPATPFAQPRENCMSHVVEDRGSLISVPLALRVWMGGYLETLFVLCSEGVRLPKTLQSLSLDFPQLSRISPRNSLATS